MSAYSELFGWYEPGSLKAFESEEERLASIPPFQFDGDADIGNNVLKSGLWPIPISTALNGKPLDKMLRMMDADMCPY